MSDESFLTTNEVLEYLRIDLRTLYRLIKARQIPAVKVGRQWRFRPNDLDAWLKRRQSAQAPASETEHSTAHAHARPHVLVVDDEPGVRDVLSKGLELAEYDVETAADGQQALQCLRDSPYELLIVDLNLPDLDGVSVIRRARQLDADTRAIIITGRSSEEAAIEAANLGVKGYLTKPFRMSRVLMAVAKALEE